MSRPEAMNAFKPEIEFALREALVMLPIVSKQSLGPPDAPSWVQREVRHRVELFEANHSNVLPIEISPGISGAIADGFSAIVVTGTDDTAKKTEVIETILAVRNGEKPPPFALARPTKRNL